MEGLDALASKRLSIGSAVVLEIQEEKEREIFAV